MALTMYFWSSLRENLLGLLFGGPPGIVALAAFGVSFLAALALVVSAIRARRSLGGLWFGRIAALVVGTFWVGAAASALVLKDAHQTILNPPPPSGAKFSPTFFAVVASNAAWFVFAVALFVVGALSFVAALVRGGKRAALGAAAAFLAAMTGGGLLHVIMASSYYQSHGSGDRVAEIVEICAARIEVTNLVRVALLAAAVLGSVVVVWFDRKNPTETSEAEEEVMLGRGAAVFALGFAAFFATRGMAHDARHPLPQLAPKEEYCPRSPGPANDVEARAFPPSGKCDVPCDAAPALYIDKSGVWIDGMNVATPDALVLVLKNKRDLLDQLRGDKEPAWYIVKIAAAQDMPARDVEPWVVVAKRAYRGGIAFAGAHPAKRFSSVTVGDIELSPRCCCSELRIDPSASPLGSYATWGEVVAASQRGRAVSLPGEYQD